MKRYANSIFTVDIKKMVTKEKEELLDKILNSKIEADCLDDSLYTPESEQDFFLDLMKNDKAECKRNFPERLIEDVEGDILAEDGKTYRTATSEDVKKKLKKEVKNATYESMYKFLNAMTVADLKKYVKSLPKLDKYVNLKFKKETIILSCLEFFKLTKEEVVQDVKKVKSVK